MPKPQKIPDIAADHRALIARIRSYCAEHSADEMAAECGVSVRTLYRWMAGEGESQIAAFNKARAFLVAQGTSR